MDLSRRRILACAPAIILTPGVLMPVRALASTPAAVLEAWLPSKPAGRYDLYPQWGYLYFRCQSTGRSALYRTMREITPALIAGVSRSADANLTHRLQPDFSGNHEGWT